VCNKKIVRDPSVFVGPLPSALPPPLQAKCLLAAWVIVGHGLRGHVAPSHFAAWFAWLYVLWVIVGHGFCITHNDTHTFCIVSLM